METAPWLSHFVFNNYLKNLIKFRILSPVPKILIGNTQL